MSQSFGRELLLDIYECSPQYLADVKAVYDFLEESVRILKVSKQSPPHVFISPESYIGPNGEVIDCSDKGGITAFVPLIESAIVLHTLTKTRFVAIDFFTCSVLGLEEQERLVGLVEETFHPKTIHQEFLERGKEYYQYD